MGDFARPRDGFRFQFGGMKTNARPDALPLNKYPIAVNIRSYEEGTIRTRPGLTRLFTMGTSLGTDIRAYTALSTDNLPRILARNKDDSIWLDTGVQVGTLAGGGAGFGASMIPFRPSDSPTPFMYIANGSDYQKFSAPTVTNAVTQRKVGIAEPQIPPDANIALPIVSLLGNNPPYTPGGTAGSVTAGTRISDTSVATFPDGTSPIAWTVNQVSPSVQYQRGMEVDMGLAATPTLVEDVFPPLTTPLTVAAIFYFSGNTGRCSIVLTGGTSAGAGAPSLGGGGGTGGGGGGIGGGGGGRGGRPSPLAVGVGSGNPVAPSIPGIIGVGPGGPPRNRTGRSGVGTLANIYNVSPLPQLRRGSLLTFNGGGGETVMVLSVTEGPVGSICFETITVNNHVAGETVTGKPGILLLGNFGASIVSKQVSSTVSIGIGTLTAPLPATFFAPGGFAFSPDDYLHFSVQIDNLANLIEIKVQFDVGDGSFTQNYFYYTVRPSDIAAAAADAQSQLAALQTAEQRALIDAIDATFGANLGTTPSSGQTSPGSSQWSEIFIPLIALTRIGDDQTKTLQNAASIRFEFNCSGTVNAAISSVNVSGGSQPDVGDIGAPYRYRFRGKSSITGAVSNPSPAMRYGVTSRRRAINLLIQGFGTPYDPQIDTWEFFRYGGSVTEWRYIGSTPVNPSLANLAFVDNIPDEAAQAGDALDFDNFEPWPTIAQPLRPSLFSPGLVGTVFVGQIVDPITGAFIPSSTVLRMLPGTLFSFTAAGSFVAGASTTTTVLTLRTRPVQVSLNTYRFEFEENGGVSPTSTVIQVLEPVLGNQQLPYMWGPDVNGTVFAVGDPLRPGTLYFAKNNAPDSAPDSFNIEITPPTEPLLGGEVIDGLSFVGSTERWWALYPQPDNPTQRYNFVQQPLTRGIVSPFGHCNDGKSLYWWAKDGIYSSSKGSLTDEDLYNLFPHEGVPGTSVTYKGITVPAPDYSQAQKFRLSYANGFLYAIYVFGAPSSYAILVLDLKRMAWSVDEYATQIFSVYKIEQQVESQGVRNPVVLMSGLNDGVHAAIYQQTDLTNDGLAASSPISCFVAVREFDGGDARAPKQWGDFFLDLVPAAVGSGITAIPMSLGIPATTPSTILTSSVRSRVPVSLGLNPIVSDFMGLFIQWTDDFSAQTVPTQLFLWQPSFDIQPARTVGWRTFGSSFGMQGFGHIRQIAIAWVSTAPITLTILTFDGQPPQALTIPSSGGVYQKQLFPLTANKGQLFTFAASSNAPFQIFEDDIEIHVGAWAREGPYQIFKSFGGVKDAQSPI